MTRRPGPAAWLVVLALLAGLGLSACGRKGPLVAPETRAPEPVADLRALVLDAGIELAWTVPTSRMDGTRLREAERTRLYRVDDEGEGPARAALLDGDAIRGWTLLTTVRPAPPAASLHGQRILHLDDRGLVPGRRYTYTVTSTDAQRRTSGPSPRVSARLIAVPEAPHDLKATPSEGEVHLSWSAPERLRDGSAVERPLAYEVLRAPGAETALTPVARTPAGTTTLIDTGVENDRAYWYAVRALRTEAGTTAQGPATARVTATPRDVTPPSAPTALVAVPYDGSVQLSWRASPEPDVAGYIVYRTGPTGGIERVGTTPAPDTTFTDRPVPAGSVRYEVSAYDRAARANESPRSAPVTVTVP